MDSPRQGFRRAAATSWTLVGIGLAGVTGASALAYADTFKPVSDSPPDVTVPEPQLAPDPGPILAPPPPDTTTAEVPPPPTPESPVTTAPPTQEYTPTYRPTYTPEPTVQRAPVQATQEPSAAPSSTPPTTKRRTPTTVMAPNYSPHVTISHGS